MAEQVTPRTYRETPRTQMGFQAAIEDLTDGLSRLVRQHFELARLEVRQEAKEIGTHLAGLAVVAAVALVGYILLNLTIILIALWIGNIAAMAITAIALTVLNLGGAGIAAWRILVGLRENEVLPQTTEEMQRNKTWIKEIRDNSSPRLTTESS